MRPVDIAIWGTADGGAEIAPIVRALGEAGHAVRLVPWTAGPVQGLVWQAADDAPARADALISGADEVIGPWMDPGEALARALRVVLRPDAAPATRIALGELAIDLVAREARRRGRPLGLLHRELDLLVAFARRPGAVLSRAHLLRQVWSLSFDPGTNVVAVHMSRLRAKLDREFDWPMLRTVRGAGYRLHVVA